MAQIEQSLPRILAHNRILPPNDPVLKSHLQQALDGYCALNDHPMECEIYVQLGGIAATWEEGRSYYTKALHGFRAENLKARVAHTLLLCGHCTEEMGDPTLAEAEFREGLQVAKSAAEQRLSIAQRQQIETESRAESLEQLALYALEALR
jgi:uncharacterized protein HemY